MTQKVFSPKVTGKRGILVLSGLDGTGKSSQASILSGRLASSGVKNVMIWNRWKPFFSAPLVFLARRSLSRTKNAQTAEYSSFTAAKKDKMRSPVKRKLWQAMVWSEYAVQVNLRLLFHNYPYRAIISDRYLFDTLVDMAVNFSIPPSRLGELFDNILFRFFPRPAMAIFFDIDPEKGATRKSDGTPVEYLDDRRALYLEMAKMTGSPVIDSALPIDEIADQVWELTSEWRRSLE
ncbi:MAG: hypothetical protein JW814_07495 [Candidatus Krumholzibacteriota bacterium]|nr:hypothetical protein [Candidatus Krumholzibacteriota bacterium]